MVTFVGTVYMIKTDKIVKKLFHLVMFKWDFDCHFKIIFMVKVE